MGTHHELTCRPTNLDALAAFRYRIMVLWMRTMMRRSQKDRTGWARINKLADQLLPRPRILRLWPNERFAVKHPRWEPDAGMPHVVFCAGGAQ
jgi:RNA-directed DNA polymerase